MQQKEQLKLNCIKNWDLKQVLNQSISSAWSQQVNILTTPEVYIRLRPIIVEQTLLKILFFPYTIVEWNKLDFDIRKSKSYAIFRNALLKIGWPNQCSIYRIHNPAGLKLLTRLRLGLSHLNEHRFNHNFQSCVNPLCSCSLAIESTTHFLLHCHHFSENWIWLYC